MNDPTRRALVAVALLATGCGGDEKRPPPVVRQESPADEVLRLSARWSNAAADQSLLSPPSAISVIQSTTRTELSLGETSGTERVIVAETVEFRSGGGLRCETTFESPVRLRYGRREGEAIVEVTRGAIAAPRRCSGAHPEPTLRLPESRVVLLLTADTLKVIEPRVDRRSFLPSAE